MMTSVWVEDAIGICRDGYSGGDYQLTEEWSRRFHRVAPDGTHAQFTITTYVEQLSEWEEPLVCERVELLRCTDPEDPGGSEVWSEYLYDYPLAYAWQQTDEGARDLLERFDVVMITWDGSQPDSVVSGVS